MYLGLGRLVARIPLRPRCSKNDSRSPENGKNDKDICDEKLRFSTCQGCLFSLSDQGLSRENNHFTSEGDRLSTDWDKAWSKFRKKAKKSMFSELKPDKYVSWNPRRSDYPLSEEVDPIKRTERSNLMLWTSPKFTLVGAIIVVSMLLIYTLLAPLK